MKTIQEIATMFNVSYESVRKWTKKGLPYKYEKVIGRRTRKMIEVSDVYNYQKSIADNQAELSKED